MGLGVEVYGQYTVLYLIFGIAGLWVFAAPAAAMVQLILQLGYDSKEVRRLGRRQMLISAMPVAIGGTAVAVALLGSSILLPAILVLGVEFVMSTLTTLNLAVVYAVDGVVPSTKLNMLQPVLRASGIVALAVGDAMTIVTVVLVNVLAGGVLLVRSSCRSPQPPLRRGARSTANRQRRHALLGALCDVDAHELRPERGREVRPGDHAIGDRGRTVRRCLPGGLDVAASRSRP